MIGHFPTPYPDELLYSLCARYGEHVQYSNKSAVGWELFGVKGSTATIDLPSRLGYLVNSLPEGHSLSVDRLIDQHTLLPFYSPFLEKNRVERLRNEMEKTGGGVVHKVAGVTPTTIRPPIHLRFCPSCVASDRRQFRECYWHRLHQVPGVLTCPKHKAFLEDSGVRTRKRPNFYAYVSAEQANLHTNAKLLDLSENSQLCLMFISQSAEWVLGRCGLVPGYVTLHSYYTEGIKLNGLSYPGRVVSVSRLREAIRRMYPPALLTALQCDFDENKEYSWPFRLVKELNLRKANHPLRHLLLIGLLGQTPRSFFRVDDTDKDERDFILPQPATSYDSSLSRKRQNASPRYRPGPNAREPSKHPWNASGTKEMPFGTGPWPCLNVTCRFHKQPVITVFHHAPHWERKSIVVGVFSCSCGYIYKRNWANKSTADQYSFDAVKAYGKVWEERLRELWNDLTLSIHKIAALLGVAHTTVKLQAVRLGLEFPRKGPGNKIARAKISKHLRVNTTKRTKYSPTKKTRLVQRYRRELLRVIKKYPSATRTMLQKHLAGRAYNWLNKNDREWLNANKPPPFKRVGSNRKVDWSTRDARLVREVRLTAQRIRNVEGRPVRVTVARIGQELDKTSLLTSRKLFSKIPLTAQALSELVETHLNYAVRCIRWAASCYRQEGTVPCVTRLAKLAGMTMTTTHRTEIRAVINEELDSLRNCTGVSEIRAA